MAFSSVKLESRVGRSVLFPPQDPFPIMKQGKFGLELDGKAIGSVDVAKKSYETFVSVELRDTFLTIEQLTGLMTNLKEHFGLSDNQKISLEQV